MGQTRLQIALALLVPAIVGTSVAASGVTAAAAGPVASYVMSPSPIAAAGTLAANATVAVTLTAEDVTSAAVPGATVYLELKAVHGGGSAFVGATRLTSKPLPFTTDPSGHIAVSYHAATTLPGSGRDAIRAVSALKSSTAITAEDAYSYSSVSAYKMKPKPVAAVGTMAVNTTRTITLTALSSSKSPVPGAVVYLSFAQGAGGGSASVGSTALTSTRQAFTANSSGVITISYKTPGTLPAAGVVDAVHADSAATKGITTAVDTYTF